MNRTNRITEILGIKYPIIQGAMSWVTNAEFVAAVSNAGGLGMLGPHAGQRTNPKSLEELTKRLRSEICKVKQLTNKPFAVPVMLSNDLTTVDVIADLLIEEGVEVVLINGIEDYDFEPLVKKLKSNNIKIIYRALNPSVENAKYAEKIGADILVATGFDEGGTVPDKIIGTFSIIPMISDAVNIPVMAAGGIADLRAVRASFALGAEGVFAGTVFIATEENPAAENVKQLIVDHTASDLLIFRTNPAYYRSIPTPYSQKLLEMDERGHSRDEIANKMYGEQGLKVGMLDGDIQKGYITVGNGISYIKNIRPVKEVVEDLMYDFN
ncbi:nitronate monooxygenase [Chryseobacterium sp. LC2016-27]|uniref:NAD(P)H-dependent flavin oxidoreductase n=1 Tax=Chryseobacterium sp. LC2016-27 TaxID=2897326 RepID=UPI001E567BFC|nr:nitronate monooxygenase [Chryseobacterium sp. LC2016-27]MCD0456380.1 nitronate monooxygenase [Chryseobacterium sp. LC2016-27]